MMWARNSKNTFMQTDSKKMNDATPLGPKRSQEYLVRLGDSQFGAFITTIMNQNKECYAKFHVVQIHLSVTNIA